MHKLQAKIQDRTYIGAIIIAAFYFFGTLGIILGYREWFVPKTAFNLLLTFAVLLLYQARIDKKLIIALAACYFIGFIAEYLGVAHGLIFGDYYYPSTLGPQLLGVPMIIGVNWFLITFVVWNELGKLEWPTILKIFLASLLTTLIDVIIEPVAIELNFWQWEGNVVPLQNYVGWFVISFFIFSIYSLLKLPLANKVSKYILFWQLFFFAILFIYFLV